ncbi:PhoX family protein [Pseudorhodoferax sp.]|uniref:PhoX family protein n=1 Tax=Pseudorhodoferax sp. TaxID=1993553 RepID=UPI0039E6CFAD
MSNSPTTSRRRLLKMIAGAPMLPLGTGGLLAASTLTACGGGDDAEPAFVSAAFIGMAAPGAAHPEALATTTVGSSLQVNFDDGSSQTYQLAYQPFFLTGQAVPDGRGGTVIAGGYYDSANNPIIDRSVPGKERQFFSDSPDGSSLLTVPNAKVDGVKGKPVFAVVQFEYNTADQSGASTYGTLPSPIAVLTLDQDPETGHLSLIKYHNVDTSRVHGLWITCGASLSPWGTHLSSEEYEPDAFDQGLGGQSLATLKAFSKSMFGDEATANPYNYGHLPEVTVNADGTGSIRKHYCLGRISHELIQVMPDGRTALMGDDYTNGGLFMFVADRKNDLSAGALYVAKYVDRLTDTSTARIQWIRLGHATSQEIDDLVNVAKIRPTDIMDSTKTDPGDASYTKITLNKTAAWVRVKAGQEKAAAFLETHRYAALKGGSMAFTKMEGTTVNAKDKVAYSALANIQDSMVAGASGYVEANNVTFPKIVAGGVVAHDLGAGQKDSDGGAIDSEWVPTQSRLLLRGRDISADGLGNTADPDNIASPDNLKFSEKLRTLFIGEDSGNHLNNFLWAYNVDTKKLERILSCPAGAESTGLHAVDEINGWTYIMSNFQHAGDEWNRFPALDPALKAEVDAIIDARYNDKASSAVGYLTAAPKQPRLG